MSEPSVVADGLTSVREVRVDDGRAGRLLYVSWAPHCSRSDHTARELGGRSSMVYAGWLGSHPATILVKYAVQAWQTWRLLRREQPAAVCVMSPPVLAALPVLAHAWRHGTRVAIDAHTCAFVLPRWRRLQWLQRLACRRAATTFVTNAHLAGVVQAWGAHATIVPDVPVVFDRIATPPRDPAFSITVVCSFASDEPIDAIFAAARLLPDVRFHMTGDASALTHEARHARPDNVTLTGFLPVDAYAGLIVAADAVLDLTTDDHTMLRGAYEAIYQGVPVVVSDWPILREAFARGAVHVANDPEAIAAGIGRMRDDHGRYRDEAVHLAEEKRTRWAVTRRQILERLSLD
jgi:glycosyltransferase involved in cell wall biosynthesis